MKRFISALLVVALCAVCVWSTGATTVEARGKRSVPVYHYFDFDTWEVYYSSYVPDCKHYNLGYHYMLDNRHAVYCVDCGIIFLYEKCEFNNDYYTAPLDYWHDRCLICGHKAGE